MKPIRVQRKRVKSWRAPVNTKYVGRGTPYGNPFVVGKEVHGMWFKQFDANDKQTFFNRSKNITHEDAVYLFEKYALLCILPERIELLRGFNFMCFCPLSKPCHIISLLKIANQ